MKASAKYNHSIFLNSQGQILMTGKGENGQLGLNLIGGIDTNFFEPVHCNFS